MTELEELLSLGTSSSSSTTTKVKDYFDKTIPKIYRIVREEYISRFEEAVNKFTHDNPEYELVEVPFYMKDSAYHAVFKLKPPEVKKPLSTIEIKE